MTERRIKLAASGITIRIEVDDFGHCLEACPLFKDGLDGICKVPKMTIPLGDAQRKRSRKCIEAEVNAREGINGFQQK